MAVKAYVRRSVSRRKEGRKEENGDRQAKLRISTKRDADSLPTPE